MTDQELDALRSALDAKLVGVDPKKGVKFGVEAFRGFARRGWFSLEEFSAFGTGAFPIKLPAYDRTRFAVADPFIDDDDVQLP
jgi:hypothetical protein